ncbi:hypothetical protein Pla22_48430 [Rubripirellula amarantea]|uniref:Polysaccharide biosynthesis protein n=1 Tax=Rubripirellula amarantea TaxID=2527999 RepID=A0A5C5WHT3_9BACT|nr:lipopolysaccharide biosynthesis protein [Rubripirellula amarantea]TWT49645.1 hypothetical protein Pla22_48430 [Rubripirellula amarantea]
MSDSTEPKSRPPRSFTRQLASSGIWSVVGRVAAIGSVLLNYRLVCETLPEDELSIYNTVLGIVALAALVCASGLGSVLLRRLSHTRRAGTDDSGDHPESETPPPKSALFFQVTVLSFGIWALVSAVFVGILLVDPLFFGWVVAPIAAIIVTWIAARLMLSLITEAARALKHFSLAAIIGGQQEGPAVNLLVLASLLVHGKDVDTAGKAIMLHLIATSIVTVFSMVFMLRVFKQHDRQLSFRFPVATSKLFSESSKVLVSQVATRGITDIETILIGKYCSSEMINTWGAIRRLMIAVSAPLQFINAAIPGFIAELHSHRDYKKMERLLRGTCTLATPPAIVAFVGICFFGGWMLAIFDPAFTIGTPSLILLAAANVIFVGAGSAGLALRMTDNQGFATVSTLVIGGLYLAITPWVIEHYQIWGAAVMGTIVIVSRNAIATALVKWRLGIWCTPYWDPRKAGGILTIIRNRKQKRIKQPATATTDSREGL